VGGSIRVNGGGAGTVTVCGTTFTSGGIEVVKRKDSNVLLGDAPICDSLGGGNTLTAGSILVEKNDLGSGQLGVDQNQVGGSVQVLKNRGANPKTVQFNVIAGNLQCSGNEPPFVGQPNVVTGAADGQCAQP
jgi:hypothetical protein